ncbi:unnamed protein product, partial [Phaeothamnion confervicola]
LGHYGRGRREARAKIQLRTRWLRCGSRDRARFEHANWRRRSTARPRGNTERFQVVCVMSTGALIMAEGNSAAGHDPHPEPLQELPLNPTSSPTCFSPFGGKLRVRTDGFHRGVAAGIADGGARQSTPPKRRSPVRVRAGEQALAVASSVFEDFALRSVIFGYQDGVAASAYPDGDRAAKAGHLSLLQQQEAAGAQLPVTPAAMAGAAVGNHLDVIKWLHAGGEPFTAAAAAAAASYNRVAVMRWAHEAYGAELDFGAAMIRAACAGHLDAVAWLHRNRPEVCGTSGGIDGAAWWGQLEVVRYLHGCPRERATAVALDAACMNGHLEVARFLHENRRDGCSSWAVDAAAMHGHLDVLEFLHGSRPDALATTAAMDGAAGRGHLEVVRWLHERRREGATALAMDSAAAAGHLNVIRFLQEHRTEGCTNRAIDLAAAGGHLAVLEYLEAARPDAPATTDAMDLAAAAGHVAALRWLHERRGEGCTTAAACWAAENGHVDVLRWLHENRPEESDFGHALEFAAAQGSMEALWW